MGLTKLDLQPNRPRPGGQLEARAPAMVGFYAGCSPGVDGHCFLAPLVTASAALAVVCYLLSAGLSARDRQVSSDCRICLACTPWRLSRPCRSPLAPAATNIGLVVRDRVLAGRAFACAARLRSAVVLARRASACRPVAVAVAVAVSVTIAVAVAVLVLLRLFLFLCLLGSVGVAVAARLVVVRRRRTGCWTGCRYGHRRIGAAGRSRLARLDVRALALASSAAAVRRVAGHVVCIDCVTLCRRACCAAPNKHARFPVEVAAAMDVAIG